MILEALKKIFAGNLYRHMIIFCLTGIPAMLSLPLNEMSKHINSGHFWGCLGGLLVIFLAWAYMWGYLFDIVHNSFDPLKDELLPDFSKEHCKLFIKGIPFLLVWGLYIVLMLVFAFFIKVKLMQNFPMYDFDINVLYFILSIPLAIIFVMFPYIVAKYTKEYKPVFDIALPFVYLTKTFMETLWLLIRALPLLLLIFVMRLVIASCMSSVMIYLLSAVTAYVSAITMFALYYCYVQIYKAKLDE